MRLILMRHAKSSWTEVGLTDHQRPLNARGRRDAPRMAAALHDLDMAPDLVLSSDSVRTRATWALMEDRFPEAEVRWLPSLYLASAHELQEAHLGGASECRTVMLLGHNPGISHYLHHLSGEWHDLPTAACIVLTPIDSGGPWRIVHDLRPRTLPPSLVKESNDESSLGHHE